MMFFESFVWVFSRDESILVGFNIEQEFNFISQFIAVHGVSDVV